MEEQQMSKKVCSLILGVLMLTVSAVCAESNVVSLDVDKDGAISVQEARVMPELLEQFAQLDVNGDGKIDMAELAAYKG